MRVRAIESAIEPHITAGNVYVVHGLDDQYFRLINDNGEPVLYEKVMFEIVDPRIPAEWVWRRIADDEYYANPPECARRGFYEDWFDRVPAAQSDFTKYLMRIGMS